LTGISTVTSFAAGMETVSTSLLGFAIDLTPRYAPMRSLLRLDMTRRDKTCLLRPDGT
jgi:hypothetical protein